MDGTNIVVHNIIHELDDVLDSKELAIAAEQGLCGSN